MPRSNTDPVDVLVGRRISERRIKLGLSLLRVSAAIRMSVRHLEEVEHGRRTLDPEKVGALAALLNVPVAYFFIGFQPPSGQRPASLGSLAAVPTLASPSVRVPATHLTITIARYSSPRCLPLTVMQDQRLVEKHAQARGLGDIAVNYPVFTTAASARDAIVAGKAQFAATVIALFLFTWNYTRDSLGIKAVGALSSTPSYLVTRHDYVNSVADFRKSDRIAVTFPKQAVFLQMAAAKAFGLGNHEKLDKLGIALPNIDAAAALIAGRVSADLNNPPFSYKEVDTPGLHVVVDSEELFGGPTTSALLLTTTTFEMKHPKVVEAVTAALNEAMALIRQDRRAAWESYRRLSEERDADTFERMISDSKIIFDREPHGLMKHAMFMRSVGTLQNNPTAWHDFFVPLAAAGLYGD